MSIEYDYIKANSGTEFTNYAVLLYFLSDHGFGLSVNYAYISGSEGSAKYYYPALAGRIDF
jgi:hypothetical protein